MVNHLLLVDYARNGGCNRAKKKIGSIEPKPFENVETTTEPKLLFKYFKNRNQYFRTKFFTVPSGSFGSRYTTAFKRNNEISFRERPMIKYEYLNYCFPKNRSRKNHKGSNPWLSITSELIVG